MREVEEFEKLANRKYYRIFYPKVKHPMKGFPMTGIQNCSAQYKIKAISQHVLCEWLKPTVNELKSEITDLVLSVWI